MLCPTGRSSGIRGFAICPFGILDRDILPLSSRAASIESYPVEVPSFEDVAVVVSEYHASELQVPIDYIQPQAAMGLNHQIVGLYKFLVGKHIFIFKTVILKQRVDGHIGVDF